VRIALSYSQDPSCFPDPSNNELRRQVLYIKFQA
jgi:hypothetical protein